MIWPSSLATRAVSAARSLASESTVAPEVCAWAEKAVNAVAKNMERTPPISRTLNGRRSTKLLSVLFIEISPCGISDLASRLRGLYPILVLERLAAREGQPERGHLLAVANQQDVAY